MSRLIGPAFAAAALASAGLPAYADVEVAADPECRVIRILPNGRQVERAPLAGAPRHGDGHSAVAVASGGSSAGVSVSASSGGPGHAVASASSTSGRRGRTVTTTHDQNGCTVVIDDRGARRARQ